MPFRGAHYRGTFNPEELNNMQDAFNQCCKLLNGRELDEAARSTLAKKIIASFESGETDPQIVAKMVAESVDSAVK